MARLDGGSTTQRINADYLYIEDNSLKWADTIIQISNISMISTSTIGTRPFPLLSILVFLIGIALVKITTGVGVLIILVGIAWIFIWYLQKEKDKETQLLKISLNSGITFTIVFYSKSFLAKVFATMSDLISEPQNKKSLTINIKDSTFSGSSAVIGKMNS